MHTTTLAWSGDPGDAEGEDMGLFRNLQPARRAEEAVDRVLEEVEARAAQGLREFVVTMSQSDIGAMNRLI